MIDFGLRRNGWCGEDPERVPPLLCVFRFAREGYHVFCVVQPSTLRWRRPVQATSAAIVTVHRNEQRHLRAAKDDIPESVVCCSPLKKNEGLEVRLLFVAHERALVLKVRLLFVGS